MENQTSRLFHHTILSFTAVLFSITTSLQFYGVFPPLPLLIFITAGTFLIYRLAIWSPFIQFNPFKAGFRYTPNPIAIAILLLLIIIPQFFLPIKSLIGAFIIAAISFTYFLRWGINGKLNSGLRSVTLIKNILLAGAWSVATVWLPCYANGWSSGTFYLFFTRFLYILVICFGVDLRDIQTDTQQNLKTLPVFAGFEKVRYLCIILLIVFATLLYIKPESGIIPFRTSKHEIVLLLSTFITIIAFLVMKKSDSKMKFTLLMDGNLFLQAFALVLMG